MQARVVAGLAAVGLRLSGDPELKPLTTMGPFKVSGSKTMPPEQDATRSARPVLVVDDDPECRGGVRELLIDEGYAVIETPDGQQALEYLIGRQIDPAVILLDLRMPVMGGWELLAVMQSYSRLSRIPVVLITGHPPLLDPVAHGTVKGLLRKPYRGEELLTLVATFAEKPTSPEQSAGAWSGADSPVAGQRSFAKP